MSPQPPAGTSPAAACPLPTGTARRLDIEPELVRLRDGEGLARVSMRYGGDAWLCARHDDVKASLSDERFSRAAAVDADVPRSIPLPPSDPNLVVMDGAEHARLRRLAAGAFTHRRMEQLRPRVQEVVDTLLDRMIAQGPPADLVRDLALPLPITMICELLGVPYEDRDQFGTWTDTVLALSAYSPEQIFAAREELKTYLTELVARRRAQPADDVLSTLVEARDEHDELTEDELVQFGVTLLIAGYETTVNQIGNFTYTLLTHPDQLDLLRADPALLPTAIEELLRFTPMATSPLLSRIALEDTELGGTLVAAGDAVVAHNPAANRDPAVFDRPDELDLTRRHNPHLAFGYGPHHCLGAHLARIELQVAIGTLFHRLPTLRFAVPVDDLPFRRGRMFRGLESLPVTW
ncbi:cytochrome P450 [Nocardia stercoris]|uniref:Cytochrome P450 n=1 Tax=Nocardia stercoris TaxID=2483361 RepID=A0A3M2LA02_9NOCA|nr:cytochrome P450 [Nocardia stercoris]RMI32755.1 cytochrome P450 [Nocardia stercoris]